MPQSKRHFFIADGAEMHRVKAVLAPQAAPDKAVFIDQRPPGAARQRAYHASVGFLSVVWQTERDPLPDAGG